MFLGALPASDGLPGTLDAARHFGVEMMDDTAMVLDLSQPPVAIFLRDPDGQLIKLLPR